MGFKTGIPLKCTTYFWTILTNITHWNIWPEFNKFKHNNDEKSERKLVTPFKRRCSLPSSNLNCNESGEEKQFISRHEMVQAKYWYGSVPLGQCVFSFDCLWPKWCYQTNSISLLHVHNITYRTHESGNIKLPHSSNAFSRSCTWTIVIPDGLIVTLEKVNNEI